ncbi:type III secretion system outer membrane ring subunit SctC [Uliginosibacterium gangwonense]|uniref:type III secretion system outer membrane ring subunit SctC n=1 Tax=Uliginosibacterium gangwonense TaxID=392736 RepID=UPI0003615806|nr:type III secretion system outer membrane ring subunit SctC [Uliginosibacterium gangwonense]
MYGIGRGYSFIRIMLMGFLLVTFLCSTLAAEAAQIPWRTSRFEVAAGGKDLKELLRSLGASQNVATWISPQVTGAVTGKFSTTPQQFLDLMASTFGISWYYDGSVLYVYGTNETRSATFSLSSSGINALRNSMDRMGVTDSRFPLRTDQKARVVVVSGPPRYVELVSQIARVVGRNVQQFDAPEVRVFPLRYAWAADHSVQVEGQTVVIPGVERILNSIFADNRKEGPYASATRAVNLGREDTAQDIVVGQPTSEKATRPGSFGAWVGSGGAGAMALNPPLPTAANPAEGKSAAPLPDDAYNDVVLTNPRQGQAARRSDYGDNRSAGVPAIRADPRTNSIVIRDIPERISAYSELIALLDNKPKVVEISATIIDVTDNALEQLGVDWRLHGSHIDLETGNGRNAQAGNVASLNPNGFPDPTSSTQNLIAATPAGGVLTAVIGGPTKYLLSRISALQQSDQAKITETPKIATLDNVEAFMNNKQTMYVRVSGYQAAQLYSITVGVALRVLPSVIEDGGSTQLRLGVHIDDGQLTSKMVDQIPIVNNSQIDTQSLIREGQSLLIAGYSVDQTSTSESGIPLLSKIPFLGRLFQYTEASGRKYHRLFLLTPKIISI